MDRVTVCRGKAIIYGVVTPLYFPRLLLTNLTGYGIMRVLRGSIIYRYFQYFIHGWPSNWNRPPVYIKKQKDRRIEVKKLVTTLRILVHRLLEGESSKSTIQDVLNRTVSEGWGLIKRHDLTSEEAERLEVLADKLDDITRLMVLCLNIEVDTPKLARAIEQQLS